jgi:hypothetical protein
MGARQTVLKRAKRKHHLSEISLSEIKSHRHGPLYVTDLNLHTKWMGHIEGIYFIFDSMDRLRYVGESTSVFARIVRHSLRRRSSMYSVSIFLTHNLTRLERKYVEGTYYHLYKNRNLDFGGQPISVINMLKLRDSGRIEKNLPYLFYDWETYKDFVKMLPSFRNRTPLLVGER